MATKRRWDRAHADRMAAQVGRENRLDSIETWGGRRDTTWCRRCRQEVPRTSVVRRSGYKGYVCREVCEPPAQEATG